MVNAHPNSQANPQNGQKTEQTITKQKLVQNSIILSKRYSNPSSKGCIYDCYSPKRPTRVLKKSFSVDTTQANTHTTLIHTFPNDKNNSKSNPNISKTDASAKIKLLDYFLKTTLGEKTFKTFNRFRKKTDLNKTLDNSKLPNKTDYENEIIKQDEVQDTNCLSYSYHKVDNSPYIVHNNQSTELKHRDVSKQTFSTNTYAKELPKEPVSVCDKNRFKTKYSPPPEDPPKSPDLTKPAGKIVDSSVLKNKSVSKSDSDKTSEVSNMIRGGLKLKERLMVGLSVFAVLFTLMLVIDIQMDLGISKKHLVPSHGKVKYVVQEEGAESAYNRFRNRLLQKTHR